MSKFWMGKPDAEEVNIQEDWPLTFTLRFRNEKEMDYFLGQLSDGWGEGHVAIGFPHPSTKLKMWLIDPTLDTYYDKDNNE